MLALGALFLLVFLVGHIFCRAFSPLREDASWAEVLFVQFFAGMLLCGWLGLLLAEVGVFSLLHLALAAGGIIVLLLFWRWRQVRRWRWPRFNLGKRRWVVVLLLIAVAALLIWPGEPILGGNDPGVYVSIAASIAKSGGIVVRDPLLPQVPTEVRAPLFADSDGLWWQLPGLYITDWARGEVTPQFLHLFPTWLALIHDAGGLDWTLAGIPFFTLLGLVAFYFLARRVAGWPAAPLAMLLLALNPAVIWYAREAASETLVMVLILGGWYLLDRAVKEPGRYDLAVLAGLALGQISLTKIELLFLPLLLYGYVFLRSTQGRLPGSQKIFLLTYSWIQVHALLHISLISWPYLRTSVLALGRSNLPFFTPTGLLLIGGGVGVAVLGVILARRAIGRVVTWVNARADWLRCVVAALWLALAIYGACVRPAMPPRWVEYQGQIYPNYNALLFLRLSWYLSLPGLVLAVLGLGYWIRRRLDGPALPFFLALLLEVALYTHRAMDYAYQFWIARRYIPLIFPFLALGLGAALQRVRLAPLGPTVRRAGLALLLGLLVFLSAQAGAPFASRREFLGLQASLADLAAQVPDGRPLFIVNWGAELATPMRYIEGQAAYALPEPVRWEAYWTLLQDWPAGEDTTYLLLDGPPPVLRGGFSLVESGGFSLDLFHTKQTLDTLPTDAWHDQFVLRLLRVERLPDVSTVVALVLEEPAWTGRCLIVALAPPAGSLLLRLEGAGYRPENVPPAELQVTWDGYPVATVALEPTGEIQELVLSLVPPPNWTAGAEDKRLELCVETWNPQAAGYNDDPRDLGVLLKSLRIEEDND